MLPRVTSTLVLALLPAFCWAQMAQQTQQAAVPSSDGAADMLDSNENQVELVLPDPPAALTSGSGMSAVPAITIREITVVGNRSLSPEDLDSITSDYEGRSVTVEQLQGLRQQLSRAYFDRGYVNSGVVIPDQQVSDNVVTLQVIEGELSDIVIDGNSALHTEFIERRVRQNVSDPLNIAELQASLRLLQEEPLVTSVNAQLVPGDTQGSGRLNLTVNEVSPIEVVIAADNHRSPSVSEERGTINLTHRSLFGRGDVLAGRFGLTDGVEDLGFSYSLPITANDTRIEAYYSKADSEILEKPFNVLDIKSLVETAGFTISRPFIRRLDRRLKMSIGFENRRSSSTLLNFPFSFSAGDVDGKAEGAVVVVAAEFMQRWDRSVFAARGTYNYGITGFGASKSDTEPDSNFELFLGQFEYIRNMGWRESRFIAKSTVQLSSDSLLAMYKLGIGGRYTVRGYRENMFVRDNGLAASVEYQVPLFVDENGRDKYNLKIATFADWGQSWDKDNTLPSSNAKDIASVGLGALWNPIEGLNAELYWGEDLDDQNLPTDTWQDRGFHFQVSYRNNF